jgi:dipeptide/tripeptide permease
LPLSDVAFDRNINTGDAATTLVDDRSFFGHPNGLFFLAFTETWERFSFCGMTALLTLYPDRNRR